MKIVSRAEWGAAPPKSVNRLHPDRVSKLVLHHTTGTYNGPATVRAIQRFHQETRNWADIGYNFLIGSDGKVYEGRGWDRTGAHARGHNSNSIGIAYIGDGRLPVPKAAKKAILALRKEAVERLPIEEVVGHRDVGSTVCPGDELYKWWVSDHTSGVTFEDARESIVRPPKATTPEKKEVSSEATTEPPRTISGPRLGGPGDRPGERLVKPRRTAVMDGWMARLLNKR